MTIWGTLIFHLSRYLQIDFALNKTCHASACKRTRAGFLFIRPLHSIKPRPPQKMNQPKHIEALGHLLTWYGEDLVFFREFQRYQNGGIEASRYCKNYPGSFQNFLNAYRVARNFQKGQTEKLLEICFDWYKQGQCEQVKRLAEVIEKTGVSHGLPVSLASKVMFLMRPDLVLPYDRQAKDTLGLGANDKDYDEFYRRALKFENDNRAALDAGLAKVSKMLDVLESGFSDLNLPFEKVRRLRLLDKMLWVGNPES